MTSETENQFQQCMRDVERTLNGERDAETVANKKIFEVGKPIPKVWLHCEFDFADTQKYLGGVVIKNEEELKRLVDKYLWGDNEEGGMAHGVYADCPK